ncbi:2-hydroxyacid dehydrogenase [Virgibacillus proomii]|uniref:2-hydroxyacid dehydrogenase n=1 Tax=Virgibacillus proomii TaxID=84407 RepID=UPI001C1273E2|nr:D-glycerate dehydrogenase [Virgibacillus proomii]MBU5267416.1 D-glycerate dehydrogenase [Virgibacillus proomii]
MNKPTIYITRSIPTKLLKPYQDQFTFTCWEKEETPVPREVLIKEAKHADGLICMLTEEIDNAFLDNVQRLQVIANLAVGYDNIDIHAAKARNIIITNTPDVLTETTADLGFGLLMTTARRLLEANDFIKQGRWQHWAPYLLAGTDVYNKTIGIVGMGRIGKAIAKRAKGFSMNILYHNRSRDERAEDKLGVTYLGLNELLSEADFVVSIVPLTDETKNMFDADAFGMMKHSAIFINISRGGVVDEAALIQALKEKQIAAAGLDVFSKEPLPKDHPLLQLRNVVALPHIGSASVETRTNMWNLCLENVTRVLSGKRPRTPVE